MSIFDKFKQAVDAKLDEVIEKSKSSSGTPAHPDKGMVELDFSAGQHQYGFQERKSLMGPEMMKTMARKDSIIAAIIQTRKSQSANFTKPQKDKYSTGFKVKPRVPADLTPEEKVELVNPELQQDQEAYDKKKYELDKKLIQRQKQQSEDIKTIEKFILNCGNWDESDPIRADKRCSFKQFIDLLVTDRYTYNSVAIEKIPTKDRSSLHNFKCKSAGTMRIVSKVSANKYKKNILETIKANAKLSMDEKKEDISKQYEGLEKPFRYVQRVRSRTVAAWTEDQMIFEVANPTVDPEDQGYGFGELEMLLQIITSHLYAEAHNRNFFTQGIGSKGILHIKGDNISRAQLEAFKRQWLNQAVNSRNAFRPPVIGMADEVKWVALTQSNREMEYESWMQYLIKVICAVFQIDPAEINFDISKTNTSTLNEGNNDQKLKQSRDKGLKPLLMFIEHIINFHLLPEWDLELARQYEFEFVGLDAESRKQEIERLEKEAQTWKTINEIRNEQGYAPIEMGDIITNASYTQLLMQKIMNPEGQEIEGEEAPMEEGGEGVDDMFGEMDDVGSLEGLAQDLEDQAKEEEKKAKESEKEASKENKEADKKEETKKSVIEYYISEDEEDE